MMEAHTLQILLAEHARLRELEKARTETYNGVVQRFIAISTTAVGATLLLVEKKIVLGTAGAAVQMVLALLLLFGIISFLGLLGLDSALLSLSLRFQRIREQFLKVEPTLKDVFPSGVLLESNRYRHWSSVKGIVHRALTISGPKTTVVVVNCLLAGGLGYALSWSSGPGIRWIFGVVFAVTFGILQSFYASWRYKSLHKYALPDSVHWWI
jgi:hypothetical protein